MGMNTLIIVAINVLFYCSHEYATVEKCHYTYLNEMLRECTGFVQFVHRDYMNVMCIVFISTVTFQLSFCKTSS